MDEIWLTTVSMCTHTQYQRFMVSLRLVKDTFRKHKSQEIQVIAFPEGTLKELTFELDSETLNLNLPLILQEILQLYKIAL